MAVWNLAARVTLQCLMVMEKVFCATQSCSVQNCEALATVAILGKEVGASSGMLTGLVADLGACLDEAWWAEGLNDSQSS